MGWASATPLFEIIIKEAMVAIPDDKARSKFYGPVLDAFCDADWDCVDECLGIDQAFDDIVDDDWKEDD